jgi:hypothetical protein
MGEDAIPGGDQVGGQGSAQHTSRKLTVAQAADTLGVTVDAIRSRIKRETMEHVREEGRVYVILGDDQGETSAGQANDQHSAQYEGIAGHTPPAAGHRDELVEELRDRVRALEEANRENRRIIAALTSRIPEIETPREARDTPETASEGASSTETPTSDTGEPRGRSRSWWRRFFGFE